MVRAIGGKKMKLGEGPVWDSRREVLYYVDIEGRQIGCYDPGTETHTFWKTQKRVGCIVLEEDGNIISAEEDMLVRIHPKTGEREEIVSFDLREGMRFNDGKCDAKGRLWVGVMAIDQGAPYAVGGGGLYCYEKGKLKKTSKERLVLENMTIPNGIAFSADNRILYHIDTPTRRIECYDFDLESGTLSRRKTVIWVEGEGNPDGMAIDCEGRLWVALWGGHAVACYDPETGRELQRIALPDKNVSCCTFGGADMDVLYITTAEDEEGKGGYVYECRVGVKGPAPYLFR